MQMSAYPECLSCGSKYCVLNVHGIADESCDLYVERDAWEISYYCSPDYICSDWQNRIWKASDEHKYTLGPNAYGNPDCSSQTLHATENELKKALIQKGPMLSAVESMSHHAMVLAGYETDAEDNQAVWIFKNSWGIDHGEKGYAKIKTNIDDLAFAYLPLGPIISPTDTSYWPAGFTGEIRCADNDGDEFCNWGISEEKPTSCPAPCRPEKDCNDSSSDLGPFDSNFNCVSLAPPGPCDADLDASGEVDQTDAKMLLSSWLLSGPDDLNLDAKINSLDLSVIFSLWGQTCNLSPTPSLVTPPPL